jgi:hypothetical protein
MKYTDFGLEQIICASTKLHNKDAKESEDGEGPVMESKRRNLFDSDNDIW